jgi:hypothetical protein
MDISADAAAASRHRSRDVGDYVRDEPLRSLMVATVAGFILGGGVNSRVGLAMLTLVGRIALRGVVASSLVELVTGSHDRGIKDSTSLDSEAHDNRRRDFQKSG